MKFRDELDMEVKAKLSANINGPAGQPIMVGLSDVPAKVPDVPYLILSQSPSPQGSGSMADPYDMRYFDYLIKSVGRDHQETTRVSGDVLNVMVRRDVGGTYLVPFVSGFQVIYRMLLSEGIVVRAQGPTLFEKNDVYRICVTNA